MLPRRSTKRKRPPGGAAGAGGGAAAANNNNGPRAPVLSDALAAATSERLSPAAALALLQRQAAEDGAFTVPMVLRTALYFLTGDPTAVDRDLDARVRGGQLRAFQLPGTGLDDRYYVETTAYARAISGVRTRVRQDLQRLLAASAGTDDAADEVRTLRASVLVLDKYATTVVAECTEASVTVEHLLPLVHDAEVLAAGLSPQQTLALLLRLNLVVRQTPTSFWLCVPGAAKMCAAIVTARTDILRAVKAKRWREMPLRDLHARVDREVQGARLPLDFHLRDMLGAGLLLERATAAGMLLSVPERFAAGKRSSRRR